MAISAVFAADFSQFESGVKKAEGSLSSLETNAGKVGTSIQGVTASTFDWKNALTSAAAVFGVAFSINAIKNWAVGVVAAGADIGDLSVKLGVSTDAVQRWKYAADLAGSSIDTVDRAVQFMNRSLSEGSTGTVAVLAKVGLGFADVRAMRPEDAFNAITEAIAKIEDPMLRAEAATRIFGKAGQELLPAIAAGFVTTADGAAVMSEETIVRLKAAEDAWSRLSHAVTVHSGEFIANVMRMHSSWTEFGLSALPPGLSLIIRGLTDDTDAMATMLATVPPQALAVGDGLQSVEMTADETTIAIRNMTRDMEAATDAAKKMAKEEQELADTLEDMSMTTMRQLGSALQEVAEQTDVWRSDTVFATEVVGKLEPAVEQAAKAIRSYTSDLVDLTDAQFEAIGGAKILAEIEAAYLLNPGRKAGGSGSTGIGKNDSAGWTALMEEQRLYAQLLKKLSTIPGFAGGVENFAGGLAVVGERGPELVTLPRGSNVTPSGAGPSGSRQTVVINITQPLGTPQAIADAVGTALLAQQRSQGARF